MPINSRNNSLLYILVLILGILIGLCIDAGFRPNHLHFQVTNNRNLSIAPRKGDIVDWVAAPESVKDAGDIQVNFLGPAPCNAKSTNPCVVNTLSGTGSFLYGCYGVKEPNTFVCSDPGMGPISTTGVNGSQMLFGNLADLLAGILAEIKSLFSTAQPAAPQAPPRLLSTDTVNPTAQVACVANETHQYTLGGQDLPIHASLGAVVGWQNSNNDALSVQFSASSPCKESPVTNVCTIVGAAGTYPFKVLDNACTKTPLSPPEAIVVP